MAAKITYDQYVEFLCKRRGCTPEQLHRDLYESNRRITGCDCEEDICQGWQCAWPTPEEEMAKAQSNNERV